MQVILILASLLFMFTPSCAKKKAEKKAASSAAKAACPVNLSLFDATPAPANVPEEHMNQLGLDFTVEESDEGGVTNFLLTLQPKEIVPWSGMPDELKGRLADFPRVSICNQGGTCLAIDTKTRKISTKSNAEFDFPFWTGIVAIPETLTGTLFFKARSCTYVRQKDPKSGEMVLSGKSVCSTREIPADPGEIQREKPDSSAASKALQTHQVELAILGLGPYLLPFAQSYLASLGGADAPTQAEQILAKLAQTITRDPYQVGAFLAGPLYDSFQDEVKNGRNDLALADASDPCNSALITSQAVSSSEPVNPAIVNDSEGNLISTATVTLTETVTNPAQTVTDTSVLPGSTSTLTNTVVQTLNNTEIKTMVTTDIQTNYSAPVAYAKEKIRVLDHSAKVTGCMYAEDAKIKSGKCLDDDHYRWNFLIVKSSGASFQISSQNDKKQCIKQEGNGLMLAKCNADDSTQHFSFTQSDTVKEGPKINKISSSNPYILRGMYEGKVANCVEEGEGTFKTTTANAANANCQTLYSIDTIPESVSGAEAYATALGSSKENSTLGTIGSLVTFGGILIGVIGIGVVGYGYYKERARVAEDKKATRLEAVQVRNDKGFFEYSKIPPTADSWKKFTPPNTYGLNDKYKVQGDTVFAARQTEDDSKLIDVNGKSPTKRAPSRGFRKTNFLANTSGKVGGAVAVIGLLTAIGGGVMWGVSSMGLANNAEQDFVNAIRTANNQFVQLRAQLDTQL